MLVPKFTDNDEVQNIFTLFQTPRERIFSTDYDYTPRKNMRKFVPKYLQQQQQQQRAYTAKNQNPRRNKRRPHLKKPDFDEHIDNYDDEEYDDDNTMQDTDYNDQRDENRNTQNYINNKLNYMKKKPITFSNYYADIKNILTYQHTPDSCIFYLTLNSNKLIGPFIFHPQLNQEQDKYSDIFLQSGKINAFNPKDLLYMRNHYEIPVNKIQVTDQILDAAYDLERFILDETTRKIRSPINRPYVDHNLTQLINDLIGNKQFTITILDELRRQISELKEENRNLRAQLQEYENWAEKNFDKQCAEIQDEKINESTFLWHAKLNALLDQYRAENEVLKSHNYTLNETQQALYQDQEIIQQQNNKLKQEIDELKRSQNLILARSQSVLREERERMNREQEELSRELANVKKKLAQSPTPCPIHHGYQRSNIPVRNNDNYSVYNHTKQPILNRQERGMSFG
ncbi:unnamed protein product [Schistosoma turkestanicum]|nr:unnamed protein product [Schistosoma turkestanicum]